MKHALYYFLICGAFSWYEYVKPACALKSDGEIEQKEKSAKKAKPKKDQYLPQNFPPELHQIIRDYYIDYFDFIPVVYSQSVLLNVVKLDDELKKQLLESRIKETLSAPNSEENALETPKALKELSLKHITIDRISKFHNRLSLQTRTNITSITHATATIPDNQQPITFTIDPDAEINIMTTGPSNTIMYCPHHFGIQNKPDVVHIRNKNGMLIGKLLTIGYSRIYAVAYKNDFIVVQDFSGTRTWTPDPTLLNNFSIKELNDLKNLLLELHQQERSYNTNYFESNMPEPTIQTSADFLHIYNKLPRRMQIKIQYYFEARIIQKQEPELTPGPDCRRRSICSQWCGIQ